MKFDHISLSEVKNFFDAVVERLAASENEKSTSVLVESDLRVFIIRFMESGLALFFGFPKDRLKEKNEQIPSLYNKVLAFSSQLRSMIES